VRLQKVHTYTVIRLLRVVLPIVVLVLVAIPVRNYLSRVDDDPGVEPLAQLEDDVAERTEDLRYSRTESGRTVFTVDADERLGTRDGRQILGGVRINIAGQDASTPDRLIDSDNCDVDDRTGNIACSGNIEIQYDDQTVIRTTAFGFENSQQAINTTAPARIERPGVFGVEADRLSLELGDKIVTVRGSVRIETADGYTLSGDSARYFEHESRVELSGGVVLKTSMAEVRARQAVVRLAPDTLTPSQVQFEGGVSASSRNRGGDLLLESGRASVRLEDGRVRSVTGESAARVKDVRDGVSQWLEGDRIDGTFDQDGQVASIEANGNGRMVFGDGQELRSSSIRNDVAASMVTSGAESVLELPELRVDGASFRIRRSDRIEFETDEPSTIRTATATLEARATAIDVDPDTGTLLGLSATGNARFEDAGREGRANRIEIGPDGSARLLGQAVATTADLKLEAGQILLTGEAGEFEAESQVRATIAGEGSPVLVESSSAAGDGSRVRFSGAANFWRDNIHVAADRIDVAPEDRSFLASGDVRSTIGLFRVNADTLEFDDATGLIAYAGNVRGRSREADIDASQLDVLTLEGEVERVVGRNNVRIESSDYLGTGDDVIYQRSEGTVTLTGSDAELIDPQGGVARGGRFVWNVEGGSVELRGDGGRSVTRRSLDTH
jgi:lipopolysaccharide export system protein LptA